MFDQQNQRMKDSLARTDSGLASSHSSFSDECSEVVPVKVQETPIQTEGSCARAKEIEKIHLTQYRKEALTRFLRHNVSSFREMKQKVVEDSLNSL